MRPDLLGPDGGNRTLTLAEELTPEESVASSLIPWPFDDSKAKYLRFRACGFSIRQALQLAGNAKSTLSLWRSDPEFAEFEHKLGTDVEFRQLLRAEMVDGMWSRNFILLCQKDAQVIERSLQTFDFVDGTTGKKSKIPVPLTKQEHEYLLKARSHYTPQQLEAVQSLCKAKTEGGFNWTDLIMGINGIDGRVKMSASERKVTLEGDLPRMQQQDGVEE